MSDNPPADRLPIVQSGKAAAVSSAQSDTAPSSDTAQDEPRTESPNYRAREGHIVRNTALVSASFVLAAGMGLLRNMIIARQFGIGPELDAFYAAFKLPDLLFTIVAGGALATAFIPVFTELLVDKDKLGAWRLASSVTNLVVIVVSVFAALAAIGAPWLVRTLIAPGFDAAQQAETAALMRLVLLSTVFFGISAIQSSVLHSFKHFLLPALAPVVYPVGVILGAIFLTPVWGVSGLALGAVIGSVLHLLVKIPGLLYYGFRWQPVLDWRSPALRRVLLLMGPRVLDLGIFHLTLLASTNLASRLGPGSVSALEWGWEFMQLPETVIGTAFGLVAFPTLSDLAARQDVPGLRATLGDTLRLVIALTAPAAVGLIVLGRPLLQLFYQGGEFDAGATTAVYIALSFFALGLVGHAGLELAARVFFAMQDTVTPLIVAAATAVLYIGLGVALMGGMGHGGLALANSLAITVELLMLLFLLRRRLHGVEGWRTLRATGRVLLASALMGVAVLLVLRWTNGNIVYQAMLGAAIGVITYGVAGWLLRIPLVELLPSRLRRLHE